MMPISKAVYHPFSNFLRRTIATKTPNIDYTVLTHTIKQNTELTTQHLTPELRLYLITPNCPLWKAPHDNAPFSDPFWAFYWPGGQAISRYILDHPKTVKNLRVLDFGCGSGACGIAAAKSGASKVLLNDIDPVACVASSMNAAENGASVEISSVNLLNTAACSDWDIILIGDMFYDDSFGALMYSWLQDAALRDCSVIIGDPGRHALSRHMKSSLLKLEEYSLPENCCLENRGFSSALVWRLNM